MQIRTPQVVLSAKPVPHSSAKQIAAKLVIQTYELLEALTGAPAIESIAAQVW